MDLYHQTAHILFALLLGDISLTNNIAALDPGNGSLLFALSRQIMVIVLLIFLLGAGPAQAVDTGNLKMYCWLGYGAIGNFGVVDEKTGQEFNKFFLNAVKIQQTKIDIRPPKETILNEIKDADVIYANTHSGYPKKGDPRMILQTGEESEISAQDLQSINEALTVSGRPFILPHQPSLVIINGCDTLGPAPDGSKVLKVNEGFGITNESKGRAYIGFNEGVIGIRGDEYFRIFFSYWTRTPYPTLAQAKKNATEFFNNPLPTGQKFLDPRDALIGEKMIIVGERNLTFDQLLSGASK
jgi:hypothetical protein